MDWARYNLDDFSQTLLVTLVGGTHIKPQRFVQLFFPCTLTLRQEENFMNKKKKASGRLADIRKM
jgi:hypothetical protein